MGGWRRVWGGGTCSTVKGLEERDFADHLENGDGQGGGRPGWGLKGRGRPADREELEGRVRGEE